MRTLVTGSSGFIGAALARHLVADGQEVLGVDRAPTPEELTSNAGYTHVEREVADIASVDLQDVDVVFHCSAATGIGSSWGEGFDAFVHDNIVATQRLLDVARSLPSLRRLVYLGSGQAYGDGDGSPVAEATAPRPHSPYAVTKCAGESLVGAYAANFGLPAVTTRLFYVVGPGQRDDVFVHRLIDSALHGLPLELYANAAHARRDFVHVDDVVVALRAAADLSRDAVGQTINIGSGVATPLVDVVRMVGDLLGVHVTVDAGDARPGYVSGAPASIERAREVLGWTPSRSVDEAIFDQVEWQRTRR